MAEWSWWYVIPITYVVLWILHYMLCIPRAICSLFFNYQAGYGLAPRPTSKHSSHRGGSAERNENTIAAFDYAVECGSQHLELDVYRTSDDVTVVFHDPTVVRTTGGMFHCSLLSLFSSAFVLLCFFSLHYSYIYIHILLLSFTHCLSFSFLILPLSSPWEDR